MEMQIQILNPKARGILEELAKLDLIRISDQGTKSMDFQNLVDRLRSKSKNKVSSKELDSEIEAIRTSRYYVK